MTLVSILFQKLILLQYSHSTDTMQIKFAAHWLHKALTVMKNWYKHTGKTKPIYTEKAAMIAQWNINCPKDSGDLHATSVCSMSLVRFFHNEYKIKT